DLVPLVSERPPHLAEEVDRVDELDLPPALRALAVGHDPDVGRDPGVVEELVGERDDRLEPVVLEDPAPDLALAAPGIAGEEGRAVEDDRDPAPTLLGRLHLRDHVLEEEERAVVDPREAGAEAAGVSQLL